MAVNCGVMGSGVAQVSATAGYRVSINDIQDTMLRKAQDGIQASLKKLEQKGTIKKRKTGQGKRKIEEEFR